MQIGEPHPVEQREPVIAFVDEGHCHREAARHFQGSPKIVNELVRLRRETGSIMSRPHGNGGGRGKLACVHDRKEARIVAKGELTLDETVCELAAEHEISVQRVTV